MPAVSWLTIAPVKGLALVRVDALELGRYGVADNRRFCLIDEDGRRYGALRDGRLQQIVPRYEQEPEHLSLRFPDGAAVEGDVELGERVTTDLYHQRLSGQLVLGPWEDALSSFLGRRVRLIRADGPRGSVDRARGPVTLVSDASLEELGRHAGVNGRVDSRRFRMLVGVTGCEPHEEDRWIGRDVKLGEAVTRLLEPVARCAITTQNPDTGSPDLDTLRTIREYRGPRPLDGKSLDFGVFGEVVRPGVVRVGDAVTPL